MQKFLPLLALFLAAPLASSQAPADHLTRAQIIQQAAALEAPATAGSGSASAKLATYPHHFTMVALRQRNGQAERHDRFADLFVVLRGTATILTGGTISDLHETAPGEFLGSAVLGGTSATVRPGDVFHIPAGLPHQVLLAPHSRFVYYVVKIEEKP
jgi:mannose-6-phosphate isomerase-like protein (cupin superfamily)